MNLSMKQKHLPTKVCLVKAMVFSIFMFGYESWTIEKAEHRRTDAFELWCWRRLLRVPWTARRWNQSILKEISPQYSLEDWCWSWSSNTLATSCKELTQWKRPRWWGRLKAEGEGTTEDEMVGWHHRLDGHEFEQAPGVGNGQGSLACYSPWGHKESETTERLNWTGETETESWTYRTDWWLSKGRALVEGWRGRLGLADVGYYMQNV